MQVNSCFFIVIKVSILIIVVIYVYNVEVSNQGFEAIKYIYYQGECIMPRVSSKENKNVYFQKREELKLTRDQASELLESIPPERIEKIENERSEPHPDEILIMADKYKAPELSNYYCANQCPIGQRYVPEVKIQDLSQIVLKMISSLNSVQDNQRRFINITADGVIDDDELEEFVDIQEELDKISITVKALRLWSEQMLANGKINVEKYEKIINSRKK